MGYYLIFRTEENNSLSVQIAFHIWVNNEQYGNMRNTLI